jgi:hypothetical protein
LGIALGALRKVARLFDYGERGSGFKQYVGTATSVRRMRCWSPCMGRAGIWTFLNRIRGEMDRGNQQIVDGVLLDKQLRISVGANLFASLPHA